MTASMNFRAGRLGRPWRAGRAVIADMGKSRVAGFTGYRRTVDAFLALFERQRAEKLIP